MNYAKIKAKASETGDTLSYTVLDVLCGEGEFDVFPVIGESSVNQLKDSLNIKLKYRRLEQNSSSAMFLTILMW